MVKNYHAGNLLSPALERLTDKKLSKLEKYAEDIVVDIFMSLEGKEHVTKMIFKTKNYELVSKARSNDMYKNIDVCVDNLKSQIVDKKPTKSHSKHSGKQMHVVDEEVI